jgi:hypothetical protein
VALFTKKTPTPEPETTGTDVVREALQARSKSAMFSTATLAKDFGVPESVLTNFIVAGVRPGPEVMAGLVAFLFHGHAVLDEALDRLKPAHREPARSLPVGPLPWSFGSNAPGLNGRTPGVIYGAPGYPRPPDAESKPAPPSRSPGWI